MTTLTRLVAIATIAAAAGGTAASAAAQPTGVWIDHTGRGAVEIAECASGGGLCGHVVWIKDSKNRSACRTQIIGNARPVGSNTWDRGWIVDPDDNARYSVELKPMGEDRLRVTGYMGSKLFSETMVWKRAPADLERCDNKQTATPAAVTPPAPAAPTVAAPAPVAAPPALPQPPAAKPNEASPFDPAPAAPTTQREAAAPMPPVPPAVVAPPPAPAAAPAPVAPAPRSADAAPEEETPPRRNAKRKTASKECRLELPYVTLKYPCDAF